MRVTPQLIAHRGASHDAPENTITAFTLAWEQGADGIEGDFHVTRDGEIVCIHDATTDRVGDRTVAVAASTLAELREIDVGARKGTEWAGQRIPTIGEVLATVPRGKRIFIEIKSGPDLVEPLAEVLAASGLQPDQAQVIAFDAAAIAEAKRRMPERKAFLLRGFDRDAVTGRWLPSAEAIVAELQRINADGVDIAAHPAVDRLFADAIRRANKEFHVWVVDDEAEARRCLDLGVDSITTNRPGWLRDQLRRPGVRHS